VLVAADIARTCINIEQVTHVVNHELLDVPERYAHGIGRTARTGATGAAISLCDANERNQLHDIERLIQQSIPRGTGVAAPAGWTIAPRMCIRLGRTLACGHPSSGRSQKPRTWDASLAAWHNEANGGCVSFRSGRSRSAAFWSAKSLLDRPTNRQPSFPLA
jgi:superfamily II DNA/RNA helicase